MKKRFLKTLLALAAATAVMGVQANAELLELQNDSTQWVMPNGNYYAHNFSELDQINRDNVHELQLAWTFQTGILDSHEASPLVVGDTMFVLTPKPNVLYALDLANDGLIKWSYAVDMPDLDLALSVSCCGAQTRGLAYADGKIFFNSLDGQLFGIDAEHGEVLWRTQVADMSVGETSTLAPLAVHDHVIVGNAGGEFSVRGWVAAYDQNTGEEVWKVYNMGPDEEMGIGPRFNPFYADDQVENVGVSTWYQDSWEIGGGSVWGWFSYDPDLDHFYYSTGNCSPGNPDYRRDPATAPGEYEYPNKYCAGLIARDASTGELIWGYSLTPQDPYDYDEPGVNLLVDMEINGEERQTLVKAARNGFFYVFDRATGELLTEPWMHSTVTWATEVDMETGRPAFDPDREVYTDVITYGLCPMIASTNWENQSYNPQTGLIHFTSANACGDWRAFAGEFTPGQAYRLRETLARYNGPDGEGDWATELVAVNPSTGEKVWGIPSTLSGNKPVTTTAGGLLLQGGQQGEFRIVDNESGEILWSMRLGSDFRNAPITYLGPDGKQYIAVIASSAPGNLQVNADAPADAAGRFRRAAGTLYVYSLP